MTDPVPRQEMSGEARFEPGSTVPTLEGACAERGEDAVTDGGVPTTDRSRPGTGPRFSSLLFEEAPSGALVDGGRVPAYFKDLNLDQIVESMVGDRQEPDLLKGLFSRQLHDADTVYFRHEVFRDLQDRSLCERMKHFTDKMAQVRVHVDQLEKMHPRHQREGWFLDAVAIYCDAVRTLAGDLGSREVRSRGLTAFRDHLATYVASAAFSALDAETTDRRADLDRVTYCVHIKGLHVSVSRYGGEADYSAEVEETFERFRHGAVKDYRVNYRGWPSMNQVGEQILDLVARLFDEEFSALDDYCRRHGDFLDETIRRADRELQFYLAFLDYIEPLGRAGLTFCYPEVTDDSKEIFANGTFDLALAGKLVSEGRGVVCNDFRLEGRERIFVVSGPNQGGKTTFARTVGQLHHLAGVGCPVPGRSARLFLFDKLFAHFEREEDLSNMSGKLEDDLVRIHRVLIEATANSIVIMNEIFTSTSLQDARFLGKRVMERIVQLGLLCVYVTFVDELASLDESVVSMVSTVVPDNPAERTYKVVRGPADGLAYALAIAQKYGLTYERLKGRITE